MESSEVTKKFQKVDTNNTDEVELRNNVLGMLALEDSVITWGLRSVRHWVLKDNHFISKNVIFEGGNRRWSVCNVELVDDKTHILISTFQVGYSKIIVWNVPGNMVCHKTCLPNSNNDNIIPITSSLIIIHVKKDRDVYYLKKNERQKISINDNSFRKFQTMSIDFIRVLKDCRNHIVTLNKCENVISIWKITRKECIEVSSYRSKHLEKCTSIECISKSVLVLTSLDSKIFLKLSSNNHIYSENLVPNFHYSQILTNFSNSVILFSRTVDSVETYHLVNIDKNTFEEIVSAPYGTDQNECQCVYLKSLHTILILTYDSFSIYKYTLPDHMIVNIKYAEIRKNARLLSQAFHTGTSLFQLLPVEICIKIISMTSEYITGSQARRLAERYFCRPLPS